MYVTLKLDLKLLFLKLIYGTWLVEIAKEINRFLLKNAKLKWFKYKIFEKSWNLSVAKYVNLKIAKLTCRKKFNVLRFTHLGLSAGYAHCVVFLYTSVSSLHLVV